MIYSLIKLYINDQNLYCVFTIVLFSSGKLTGRAYLPNFTHNLFILKNVTSIMYHFHVWKIVIQYSAWHFSHTQMCMSRGGASSTPWHRCVPCVLPYTDAQGALLYHTHTHNIALLKNRSPFCIMVHNAGWWCTMLVDGAQHSSVPLQCLNITPTTPSPR